MPDGLYTHQNLHLDAFDQGERSARGAHITSVPRRLVADDRARQGVDQFGSRRLVSKEIHIPGFNRDAIESEGGAPGHRPPAALDDR